MPQQDVDLWTLAQGTAAELTPNIVYNSHYNWRTIADAAERGDPVCVSTLPHVSGIPAIVLGSGPSLDQALPLLRSWPGAIFCGPSQVKALDAHHREPDYIVAIDTAAVVAEQLDGPLYSQAILITHQAIDPSVLDMWRWRRRFVRLNTDNAAYAYPWLRLSFTAHGCTPNAALQLAAWLGYSPIYLVGVDCAYVGGVPRCATYQLRGRQAYIRLPPEKVNQAIETLVCYHPSNGHAIETTREMYAYKLLLLAIWRLMSIQLYTTSRDGLLWEVPYADLADVIASPSKYKDDLSYPWEQMGAIVDAATVPAGLWVDMANRRLSKAGSIAERLEAIETEQSLLQVELSRWSRGADGRWSHAD